MYDIRHLHYKSLQRLFDAKKKDSKRHARILKSQDTTTLSQTGNINLEGLVRVAGHHFGVPPVTPSLEPTNQRQRHGQDESERSGQMQPHGLENQITRIEHLDTHTNGKQGHLRDHSRDQHHYHRPDGERSRMQSRRGYTTRWREKWQGAGNEF